MAADVFITPDIVKTELKVGATVVADDTAVQNLCNAINSGFLNAINRPNGILSKSYTEIRDGNGKPRMVLRNFPITAVTTVQIGPYVVPLYNPFASTQIINTLMVVGGVGAVAGYVNDDYTVSLYGGDFPKGRQNIMFVYTAGYAQPPLEIVQALTKWAALVYRQKEWIGKKSDRDPVGLSTTYDLGPMPDETKRIVQQYMRRGMPGS